jgi:ankyrin repeat protein
MRDTPLHQAAAFGHSGVVAVLLKHGADVNARDALSGYTPLMRAVIEQRAGVARQLIAAGAKVNLFDNDNSTALHNAVTDITTDIKPGRLAMVKLLVELGADVNACRAGGETPLAIVEHTGYPPGADKGNPDVRAISAYLRQHGARTKCSH